MAASKAKIEPEIIDVDDADEMREELERSTADMNTMRTALEQEQQTSARLREQMGRQDGDESVRDGRGLRWFFAEIWSYPQFRMLAFALVVAVWLAASSGDLGAGNLGFAAFALLLFCKWAECVYRNLGPGQLVLKCIAAIAGLVLILAFVLNETKHGAGLPAASAALTVTALLVMSKATERLAKSHMPLVRFVRAWF